MWLLEDIRFMEKVIVKDYKEGLDSDGYIKEYVIEYKRSDLFSVLDLGSDIDSGFYASNIYGPEYRYFCELNDLKATKISKSSAEWYKLLYERNSNEEKVKV